MKIWRKLTEAISRTLLGTWCTALGFSGLALALAADSSEGSGSRWARSGAAVWGLTRHDGTSVLDWVAIGLMLIAVASFALSQRSVAEKVANIAL
jgi:hypothetical protein